MSVAEHSFQRARAVFEAVCDCAEPERQRRITELCAGDAALCEQVLALCRADAAVSGFLESPPLESLSGRQALENLLGEMSAALLPERVGAYRIIRLIGEGGMGSVYEAQQPAPCRRIALKVIRPSLISPRFLRRFRNEAEIMGRIQHPHLAQIYEAGMAAAQWPGGASLQVPYLAMELVDGRPLGAYLREANLGLARKLELFVKICRAVQHGHMRGIIHRDLKPTNILVSADAEPKVIDFGVACAVDGAPLLTTTTPAEAQFAGTLQYMSPEQLELPVCELDIRCDVYALGLVLYEMLSGELPYHVTGSSVVQAAQVIREATGRRLSAIDRSLRGDLETIVRKAIEKDRERRYGSSGELAADVERFLRGEAISARPPSLLYLGGKLVRRHRVPAMLAACLLLLGMLFTATTWMQSRQIRAERDAKARQAALAQTTSAFLQSLLAQANPKNRGREVTVGDVLIEAAPRIDRELSGDPGARAKIHWVVATTFWTMGRTQDAQRHLDRAWKILSDLDPDRSEETLCVLHEYADLLTFRGEYDAAERLLRPELERMRRQRGPADEQTLDLVESLASVLSHRGEHAAALEQFEQVVSGRRRAHGEAAPQTLAALRRLALAQWDAGALDAAVSNYEQVLAHRGRLHSPADHQITIPQYELGSCLVDRGGAAGLARAEAVLRQALAGTRERLGAENLDVAVILGVLAKAKARMNCDTEAETLFRKTLNMKRELLGDQHHELATTLVNYGDFLRDRGRLSEAEAQYSQAWTIRCVALGKQHPDTVIPADRLADARERIARAVRSAPPDTALVSE